MKVTTKLSREKDAKQKKISDRREKIKSLESRMDSCVREIESLEQENAIDEAYVQAMGVAIDAVSKSESKPSVRPAIKSGSRPDMARKALASHKKPMHIGDLLGAMGVDDTEDNRTNVSRALSSHVTQGRVFTRPASYTFGLLEWGDEQGCSHLKTHNENLGELSNAVNDMH